MVALTRSSRSIQKRFNGLSRNVDVSRLCNAMRTDRIALQRFRSNRREMVREYLGNNWNDEGSGREVPLNLVALYASIMTRALVPKNPRVMLSTFNIGQKPAVSGMQRWANSQIVKMRLENTIRRAVLDALFSVGIIKVGIATPADAATVGWRMRAGGVFVENVDPDDWVWDTHAHDFGDVSYMGHRIRVPLSTIMDSDLYSPSARKLLMPQYDQPYNLEGDERIGTLGRGLWGTTTEEIEDYVDLWEIYLPRHRLIVTLADDQMTGATGYGQGMNEALRVQNYIGPDCGPYYILNYLTVPGNAMGKGPIQDLIDLHRATNNIYRKLIRQAHRMKENTFVYGQANDDGTRIMQSNDGDLIKVENPQSVNTKSWGGPNQQIFQLGGHLKDTFDFMAGGLSLMGGLGPQSKTLGQDKLLNENSSHQVQDMQGTTINYTSNILEGMNWYYWYDPKSVMKSEVPLRTGRSVITEVHPQDRQGEMPEVAVDPYSMIHTSPQERLQFLNGVVQTVSPMMPLLQQQGIMFDINFWLKKMAEYGNAPDLGQMFTLREPIQSQSGGQGGGGESMSGKPSETTRNYVRRSIGQDTPANRQATMSNDLSANIRQNEMANAA